MIELDNDMFKLFYNNQACRIDDDLTLVGGENCPTSIILVCDLANHALGGLRCPLCFPTRLCIPESDRPDFIVCPTITMGAYNPMPLWPVIACIIIKLPALYSALGEVYWCCGTQFVHCSRLASRQKAKLYPANTLAHLPASLQPTLPSRYNPRPNLWPPWPRTLLLIISRIVSHCSIGRVLW